MSSKFSKDNDAKFAPKSASRVSAIVGEYLDHAKRERGLSQADVAERMGLNISANGVPNNILSLVKNGRCKMPDDRIEDFVRVCGIQDSSDLIEAVAEEYYGSFYSIIKKVQRLSFSKTESTIISAIIDAKRETDIELRAKGMSAAKNRSEEQLAGHVSTAWAFDDAKLADFKAYIKKNLIK